MGLVLAQVFTFNSISKADVTTSPAAVRAAIILADKAEDLADMVRLEEARESSPSSPPLDTDDTGTPGPRGIEVNFITECDRTKISNECEGVVDANFGIGQKIQLRIEKGVVRERARGERPFNGVGPTDVGVKYRFYDHNGLAMAVYPSIELNDATRHKDENGIREPGDGKSVYLPIIISKELGKFTIVGNAGIRRNLDRKDANGVFTSLALGRGLSETSRVMGEITSETEGPYRRNDVRVGWVKVIFPDEASNYETAFFTSVGHSIGKTEDGQRHMTVRIGLSISRKPSR